MTDDLRIARLREVLAPANRLSELFHSVNSLIPPNQEVVSVPPTMLARDALALMREKGYSQLPVRTGRRVLGMFTYRGFALEVAEMAGKKSDPTELPVAEFLNHDEPVYARLTDAFQGLVEKLNTRDAVLVSGPEELLAMVTPMDVLRYLLSVANAFVLIQEIELSVRNLIRLAVPNQADFERCVTNAQSTTVPPRPLPARLEDMTFDQYIAVLRTGSNWTAFEPVFGGTQARLRAKLERVRDLRNDVFHFRRELSVDDHQQLATARNWLLRCTLAVEASPRPVE